MIGFQQLALGMESHSASTGLHWTYVNMIPRAQSTELLRMEKCENALRQLLFPRIRCMSNATDILPVPTAGMEIP